MDWSKIEEGTPVVVNKPGEMRRYGVYLMPCGGREKGKLRINLDDDTAKYREIPEKFVSLITQEKPIPDPAFNPLPKPEEKAAGKLVGEKKGRPCEACVALKNRIRNFIAACDPHVTKEELQRAFKNIL